MTVVMSTGAPGAERCAEALRSAGVTVEAFLQECPARLDPPAERAAYHEAIQRAHSDSPQAPIILWGAGYDGGHVLQVAAQEGRVTGVISVAPVVDGLALAIGALRERRAGAAAGDVAARDLPGLVRLARTHRPARHAPSIRCPVLIQIADEDTTALVNSAMLAARRAGANVRHYPYDRHELFSPSVCRRVVEHELAFLRHIASY